MIMTSNILRLNILAVAIAVGGVVSANSASAQTIQLGGQAGNELQVFGTSENDTIRVFTYTSDKPPAVNVADALRRSPDSVSIRPVNPNQFAQVTPVTYTYVKVTIKNDNGEMVEVKEFLRSDVATIRVVAFDGDDFIDNTTNIPSTIYGGMGNDVIAGGSASDSLLGESGADNIYARGGNDTLHAGNDPNSLIVNSLFGDGGNDTFIYNSQDRIRDDSPAIAGIDLVGWQITPDHHFTSGPNAGMSRIGQ